MKIYNLGSCNVDYVYTVDHFVAAGETLSSLSRSVFPGGKGLNQSIALARAGAPVIHGILVGDGGELLVSTLEEAGVDTSRMEKRPGSCGHTIIQVDKKGQNCILLFPGTNYAVDEAYIQAFLSDAEAGDILVLQNEISCLDVAFRVAHEKQLQIAFNPSPYHENIQKLPLGWVKWWFCNEIESKALFGSSEPEEIGEQFRKAYPDASLILTLGEMGSVFIDAQGWVKQPAYPVRAVDTTAAGDTYTGYFLAAIAAGSEIPAALDLASRAAAVAVSRPGAATSIPTLLEVKAMTV